MPNIDFSKIDTTSKFMMLEELWIELSKDATNSGFTPKWHLDILSQREDRVKNGKSKFNDLNDVKKRLRKLVD